MGWGTPSEMFTDDTQLGSVVSVLEGRVAIQKWADKNHDNF